MMFYARLSPDVLARFHAALEELREIWGDDAFYGDHLIAVGRSIAFLRNEKFTDAVFGECRTNAERAMIWRFHTLAWCATQALSLPGDFVECGVYEAVSTRILARYLDFGAIAKQWYLYDLFENPGGEGQGVHMAKHGPRLYERVVQALAIYPNIQVTKGRVPEIFSTLVPDRIAFLHLDLNDAGAEIAALSELFPRIVPGGMIVLDDYGWAAYRGQQEAEEPFFSALGHTVLELPTGQGLVIKR
jgi:O-methyltransferase